ncbi:MlaD family protein [Draconibacterium halophilum]|uniref:MCE family protein n=1 Tax=Draconibacterium halophilum TaxID=2706887 RepID=A0A6C0RI44_9BACT|nr:MlaD family protein [Draconibacterium halophilum]QIA09325.1 MCE family protein [Draconibacterium halophilum]
MKERESRSLKLGIMVTVGLVLFAWGIYYLGSQRKMFTSSVTVKSYFNNVSGLVEGNKVRYSGITVGSVLEIGIVSDSTILVEMSIDKKTRKFIRKDSKVEINSDGLMGSKIVNILPGTASAGSVSDDELLMSLSPLELDDVLQEVRRVIDDGQTVTNNLIEITNKINKGNGDLALLLNDNTVTTRINEIGNQLAQATENVNSITTKIDNGDGDLGRLINDSTLTTEMQKVVHNFNNVSLVTDSITNELLVFSRELNTGNGVVTRLVYDHEMANNVDTTIAKAGEGIDEVVEAAKTIDSSWIFNLFSGKKK